eukprot:scaffold166277_cov16-Tisochrysis_lutea.AAC.2
MESMNGLFVFFYRAALVIRDCKTGYFLGSADGLISAQYVQFIDGFTLAAVAYARNIIRGPHMFSKSSKLGAA